MTETIDAVKLRELVDAYYNSAASPASFIAAAMELKLHAPTLARAYLSLTERAERAEKALRDADEWLGATLNMVDGDGFPPHWDGIRKFRNRIATIAKTSPAEGEKK